LTSDQICIDSFVGLVMEIIRIVYPKSVHYSLMGFGATVLLLSHYTTKDVLDLAPNLYALVPKRRASRRKVMDALVDENWVADIQGEISLEALWEYLDLWDILTEVELQEGNSDKHIWRLSSSGVYTAKSAYDALFEGAISFAPYERIWKSWAPPKCRFFMWLAAHNRCWTADRLARRGLTHPDRCLLCDQEEENIQHLLIGCVCKTILV